MPAKFPKPRIAIYLRPHVYETIKRFSELNGQPMSRIVADLVEAVADPLMRTVALLEAAAAAPKEVKDGLRNTVENIERDLYGAVGYTTSQIDWLTDAYGKKGGGEKAGACAAASPPPAAYPAPVSVTRGSGSQKTPPATHPKPVAKPIKTRDSKGSKRHG